MILKHIITLVVLAIATTGFAQESQGLRTDGLYHAKTGVIEIPNNNMDIYTYLKFTDDGTVYTQAVSGFAPQKVAVWLGAQGRHEYKGTYALNGQELSFGVDNNASPDKSLEGAKQNSYAGTITAQNTLVLTLTYHDGEQEEFVFEFTPKD